MAEDGQSSKRDGGARFQPRAASPRNQPESWDQALLRAHRLHWAVGHGLPNPNEPSLPPSAPQPSFFHNQGTSMVHSRSPPRRGRTLSAWKKAHSSVTASNAEETG